MSAKHAGASRVSRHRRWPGGILAIMGLVMMLWVLGSVAPRLAPIVADHHLVPWAAAPGAVLVSWGLLLAGAVCVIGSSIWSGRGRALAASMGVVLAAILLFIQWAYPHHLLWKPQRLARAIFGQDLALRDYAPMAMLRVASHEVLRARYPVINIHAHFRRSQHRTAEQMTQFMDACNVERIVDLDGGLGDKLQQELARYTAHDPTRFITFATFPFSEKFKPKLFAERIQQLDQAKAQGARGIKVWKYLGLVMRDSTGAVVPVDDARIDPLWETAGRLQLPILIHLGDPLAFFEPIDARNERYEELTYFSPGWSFAGPQYPRPAELLRQFERVLERHRTTTFIGAHMMSLAEDLQALGAMLDRDPNLYVDISARANELGRQPRTARVFLIRYADRVLFGTDGNPDDTLYRGYFRLLETADEYFEYPRKPGYNAGRWAVYGLDLPDEVLRKIYHDNAARLLGMDLVAGKSR